MQTGRTRHSENMNIVVFSCINFELTLIKQKYLNKQGYHEGTHFINVSTHFSSHLTLVYLQFYVSSQSLVSFFHASVN